jgi:hypothetical protein
MKFERNMPRIGSKIIIGRQNREAMSNRNSTNKKIDMRALNTVTTASIEEFGSQLIIVAGQREIRKGTKMRAQRLELGAFPDAGEDLLPDWPDELNSEFQYELFQLGNKRVIIFLPSSQCQRPYTSIYENLHGRFRDFL